MEEKTVKLNLRECSKDIFRTELTFLESHGVFYIGQQYAIVCRANNNIMHIFDELNQIAPNVYVLSRKDANKVVLLIYKENSFLQIEGIKQIVRVFKEYILVEYPEGKKGLYTLYSFEEVPFETLPGYSEEKNYVIIKLPNNKFTLLTKDLRVADVEFNAIKEDSKSFVIVKSDHMYSTCVVRISDLKVSPKYYNILFYGSSDEYVKVCDFSKPPCIMKVSDFEKSDGYLSIAYLSNRYALVKEDCYSEEKILRLNDFAVSKWDKKQS